MIKEYRGRACVRGGGLANRQTLNSYDDPDELSVVPIITASLSNLLGQRPNMLQTCSGIPLANTFVDTCATYATRITVAVHGKSSGALGKYLFRLLYDRVVFRITINELSIAGIDTEIMYPRYWTTKRYERSDEYLFFFVLWNIFANIIFRISVH